MPSATRKKRQPPKRTRRVSQPFDDRLEVRCYKAEKAYLAQQAKDRGMTVGDLIRFQLGDLLGPGPAQPVQTPAQDAAEPEKRLHDLSAAIAEAFGIPVGKAIITLRLGRVEVAGEPWFHSEIPEDLLGQVTVQGEPLPIQAPDGDQR